MLTVSMPALWQTHFSFSLFVPFSVGCSAAYNRTEKKTSLRVLREAVEICLNRNTKRGKCSCTFLCMCRLFETLYISRNDCSSIANCCRRISPRLFILRSPLGRRRNRFIRRRHPPSPRLWRPSGFGELVCLWAFSFHFQFHD